MIPHRFPSFRLTLAYLALGWFAVPRLTTVVQANEGHGEEPAGENLAKEVAVQPAKTTAPEHPVTTGAGTKVAAKTNSHATDEIHGLLKLGANLTERADYDSAEIAYRQVLNAREVAPADLKSAFLGLARMHRKQGALTKAAAIYERYLKEYPGDDRAPDALLELGRTLRSLGTYKLAIARFYSVLNSTLKLPGEGFERYQILAKTAQFEIAQTHFEAGEFAESAKFFTRLRLLDLAPADRARAHFMAAYSQRLQGDLEGAVTTLRAFISQSPDDENVPEARSLLAMSLRELKRPREAMTATLELLREEKTRVAVDPKRWAYWQRRTGNQLANEFFETGDTLNAHAVYTSLVELSPELSWRLPITYQIALCYERLGMLDRARSSYQSIIDAAPPADLAELVRMATWRLEHLAWRERVDQQVAAFFVTSTGKQAALTNVSPAKAEGSPLLPVKNTATP